MCSHESCKAKSFYDIDGTHYCKTHNLTDLGICGVIQNNGSTCPCPVRRSRKGVRTCLVHVPKSTEVISCSICLDDCPIGTKPTKCGHFFHAGCIKEWKKQVTGNTCPVCRVVITPQSKKSPDANLLWRVSQIARETANTEEFLIRIEEIMTTNELEMVLELVRNFT
jgi:hypothetical protein